MTDTHATPDRAAQAVANALYAATFDMESPILFGEVIAAAFIKAPQEEGFDIVLSKGEEGGGV